MNANEGWSRDVTVDIAGEMRRRYVEADEPSETVLAFVEASVRRRAGGYQQTGWTSANLFSGPICWRMG